MIKNIGLAVLLVLALPIGMASAQQLQVTAAATAATLGCQEGQSAAFDKTPFAVFGRRSNPERRFQFNRLSPTNLFSSSDRVSAPLRRSLPERLSPFSRLSSSPIAPSPLLNHLLNPRYTELVNGL
jgi:hypothetical protein